MFKCKWCGKNYDSALGTPMGSFCSKKCKEEFKLSKENKKSNSSTDNGTPSYSNEGKMHWGYFWLIGWWLGLSIVSFIIPLFSLTIRKNLKKIFGYW